jgi:hypothetical protein
MNLSNKILNTFKQKKSLNPEIWTKDNNGNYVLKEEVRDKLLLISNDFLDFIDIDNLETCNLKSHECSIDDITITGSICNYNWSKFSDIDLHLIMDFESIDENKSLVRNILNTKKNLWNAAHNVAIKGYEVEVYAQDSAQEHFSSGVYSILYGEWIVEPKTEIVEIDMNKIMDKARGWMELIDALETKSYNLTSEETIDLINKIKTKLKKFRVCGLENEGEYSYENLAFKFLRRSGHIKKLFELKNKLTDLSLSLD